MEKNKIIIVLLLINLGGGIFFTSLADAAQNNLSNNYLDASSRPLPISDDISRFIPSEKKLKIFPYEIYPIPPVKPDASTYKSPGVTTLNNILTITSLNYTNIAKPGGLVNISFTVDGYIDNTDYYIGIYDRENGVWIKDDYQFHNGTFSKKYDWNFTTPPIGQKYWLSVWYWESSNSSFIVLDSVDINIDLMLPDLKVKDIRFSNNIASVNISNSGYTFANNINYSVYDGNPNPNYMNNNSYRKTKLIHSDNIPILNSSDLNFISILFPIDPDFHKAYVVVDPRNTIQEINESNNNASKAMRLNSSVHELDVLAVIYTNYIYKNLSMLQIDFTKNQIDNYFKQFYWDHTLTLRLNISYLQIDDLYNNSHLWEITPGKFWMSPWDVESDLRNKGVTDNAFDTVYVFYAWENTYGSEAAYGGGGYGPDINWMGNTTYASEPIFHWGTDIINLNPNILGEIAIHEVLHNIDGMYEAKGDSDFKNSDNMGSETTFEIPMEYYEWMLETWPTQKLFELKWGTNPTNCNANYCSVHNINRGTNYATIQAAIDDANPGDEILVDSGTYYEKVNVNKQLILFGIGMPVVNAGGSGTAITLAADGIILEGFTATNAGTGISVTSNYNTLTGNNANSNYWEGLSLYRSRNNTLIRNNVSNNLHGISLKYSSNSVLKENIMEMNSYNFGSEGSSLEDQIDTTNLVDGKPVYYINGARDIVYDSDTNAGTFYCMNCVNVTLKNLELKTNTYGIVFMNTTHSKIQNVNAQFNAYGMDLSGSSNNTLSGNNANYNQDGIVLESSSNNTLISNNAYYNQDGISLESSSNNTLISNNAYYNQDGISLDSSSKNMLIENNAKSNNGEGLSMNGSSNNMLIHNNVSINIHGISLKYSSNNVLKENIMEGNNYNFGSEGSSVDDQIDTTNLVDGKPVYYINGARDMVYDSDTNAGTFYCINCVNVTLKNLELKTNTYGIVFVNTTHSKMQNVNAANNTYGIDLRGSSNNMLSSNTANSNNIYGIYLDSSSNNTLSGNTADSNNIYGIDLFYSSNNTLSVNNVSNDTVGIVLESSTNNTLSGNTANSNKIFGISLESSSKNTLSDNTANSNKIFGISLESSSNNMLSGNNAANNDNLGIFLASSINNTLSSNTANSNQDGIYLSFSSNNTLSGNNASNNYYGIILIGSSENMLSDNNVTNKDYGIFLDGFSNNNTLSGNNASNNKYGIFLILSGSNTLSGNTARSNDYRGIHLSGSSNNLIYNNYFNNTNNAYDDGTNIWNTTKSSGTNIIGGSLLGGNFWAYPNGTGFSQTCTDAEGDGICDTFYALKSNNTDHLPLASPSIPWIEVISPNGGNNWAQDSTQVIRWNYKASPGPNVMIELLKNGVLNSVINSSTPIGSSGSGSYNWSINSTQPYGTDYKIRITSTTNSTYTDTGNDNFTIRDEYVNLIKNGGFESGKDFWTFYTSSSGFFNIVSPGYEGNNASMLPFSSMGTNIQLYQIGVTLEPKTSYRLSFAAYSNTGHDVTVRLSKHVSPFTSYGLDNTFNLSTSWQIFTIEFNTTGFTSNVSDGRFHFWLAPFATAGEEYYFDSIILEKVFAPTISMQPLNQTVNTGQNATFSVLAAGSSPLSYQWQKNGTYIPGATRSSYVTSATTTSDNGTKFSVIVSNVAGNVTSNNATLVVVSKPEHSLKSIGVSPSTLTLTTDEIQQFTATAIDQNDHPMEGINISWESSNLTVGNVTPLYSITGPDGNASTVFTAYKSGIAVIKAANGSINDTVELEVTEKIKFTLPLKIGWNMVSLPIIPDDPSVTAIFGSNVTTVYGWTGTSYVLSSALEPKRGYWVLSSRNYNITVTGTPVVDRNIILTKGWNMVGPVTNGVMVSSLPNVTTVYGWTGTSYTIVSGSNTLALTKGYWMLANATSIIPV